MFPMLHQNHWYVRSRKLSLEQQADLLNEWKNIWQRKDLKKIDPTPSYQSLSKAEPPPIEKLATKLQLCPYPSSFGKRNVSQTLLTRAKMTIQNELRNWFIVRGNLFLLFLYILLIFNKVPFLSFSYLFFFFLIILKEILYSAANLPTNGVSPCHVSSQNLVLSPLTTFHLKYWDKSCRKSLDSLPRAMESDSWSCPRIPTVRVKAIFFNKNLILHGLLEWKSPKPFA